MRHMQTRHKAADKQAIIISIKIEIMTAGKKDCPTDKSYYYTYITYIIIIMYNALVDVCVSY